MAGVRHSGLSNVSSVDQTLTDDLSVTGDASICTTVTSKLGFFGATGISQRSGAGHVTVSYSGTVAGFGWSTSAQFEAFVLLVNSMQRDLLNYGLIGTAS
jgi:hypothetical protein